MSVELSEQDLTKALPKNLKMSNEAKKKLKDSFNDLKGDQEFAEHYRNNLLSYTNVLRESKFGVGQYLDAVKFVGYRLLGKTIVDSYKLAFPKRYAKHVNTCMGTKGDVASYATAYNRTKLVTSLMEQTLVPSYILNQDLYQRALNKQAELMSNPDVSFKVQSDAANSLLTHLKMPETQKVELDVGIKESDAIRELREATLALAAQQRDMVRSGAMNIKEVAESKVVEAEYERIG